MQLLWLGCSLLFSSLHALNLGHETKLPLSLRRLGQHAARLLLLLFVAGLLGATLARFAPGFGVDEEDLDSRLNHQSMEALRHTEERNHSIGQFYIAYFEQLAHGDLGVSRELHRPVRQLLLDRLPETLHTVALGLMLGWASGLLLAVLTVTTRWEMLNVSASLLASLLLCVPAAVLALLFMVHRIPARFVLGLVIFPKVFQCARTLLMRGANRGYVLAARAKGAGELRLVFRHILPVTGSQLLALAGVSVSLAFTAVVPVEVMCDLPGIGQLAWHAALARDLPLLVALTLVVTFFTVVANSAASILVHPPSAGKL